MTARHRLAALLVSSALTLSLTACANDSNFSQHNDALEQQVILPVEAPQISMESIGEDPQLLQFSDEQEQQVTISVHRGFVQSIGDETADPTAPAGGDVEKLKIPLELLTSPAKEIDSQDAAKLAPATREINSRLSGLEPSDLHLVEDLRSADGFRAGWRANSNGHISALMLTPPVDASDQARSNVEAALRDLTSVAVVLPEEPVGVGGQWRVEIPVSGPSTMLQTTTYTITAIEGRRVDLDIKVSQRPSVGALALPEISGTEKLDDTYLHVLSSDTTSVGEVSIDLDKPLPIVGRIALTTRVIYGGAGKNRVIQDSTTAVDFKSPETP